MEWQQMGYRYWKIIACVFILVTLISLTIASSILLSNCYTTDILFYKISFSTSIVFSLILLSLFMRTLSKFSWKFMTSAVYLSAVPICVLLGMHSHWDYMFYFTSGVNLSAILVFLLIFFLGELDYVIGVAILLFDLLFVSFNAVHAFQRDMGGNYVYYYDNINFTAIKIDGIVCSLISVVILSLYLRSSLPNKWKVVTTIFFISAYAFFIGVSYVVMCCNEYYESNVKRCPGNVWIHLFILNTFIYVLNVGTTLIYIFFSFFGVSAMLSYVIVVISLVIFIIVLHIVVPIYEVVLPEFSYIVIPYISTLIFFFKVYYYVSHTLHRKWKLVVIVFALCTFAGFVFTYAFSNISKSVIANVSIGIEILLSTLLCLWIYGAKLWIWWKRTIHRELVQPLPITGLPARYTYRDISQATENFQYPIGEGGSSTVFKGKLSDGMLVAVKQIIDRSSRESQFLTELTVITSLQHVNLVRLIGYCLTSTGERYLIYPFYENGDLKSWLFGDEQKKRRLTWRLRYQIAIDVAKAVKYLHHDCHHQILHLDVKPENILLDDDFRALVTDFGISKLIGRERTHVTTIGGGTFTYMAPEVWARDAISVKTDVYSFGMVLMELAAGRKNNESGDHGYFLKIARDKMLEGELLQIADNSLSNGEAVEEELPLLVKVGFWCIQNRPSIRPKMVEIADMLEGCRAVEMPPRSPIHLMIFLDEESQEGDVVPLRIDEIEMTCVSLTNSLTGR